MSELDTYYMTDQPEQCRKCGTRTTFEDIGGTQHHKCPRCLYEYELEEDEDGDGDGDECPHCGSRNTAHLEDNINECHDCGKTEDEDEKDA